MNIPRRIHPDTVDAREGLAVGEYGIYPVEQVRSLIARAEKAEKDRDELIQANQDWRLNVYANKTQIEGLQAELAEDKARTQRFAKFIVIHHDNFAANGDWACSLCKPYSDMLKEGFVCAFHEAEAIIAAEKGTQ